MTDAPPMLQHHAEFQALLDLYRERRPRRVLEVGVYLGGTLYHWLRDAPAGATVVAVDDRHHPRESYAEWAGPDVEVVAIQGNSNDRWTARRAALHGPYDWVFIDADHHEPNVRRDWLLYSRLAAPGAVVAFHDISPTDDPTIEVDRLWVELRDQHETLEIVHEHGQGIGLVLMPAARRS